MRSRETSPGDARHSLLSRREARPVNPPFTDSGEVYIMRTMQSIFAGRFPIIIMKAPIAEPTFVGRP
jgi:hypothetical protein